MNMYIKSIIISTLFLGLSNIYAATFTIFNKTGGEIQVLPIWSGGIPEPIRTIPADGSRYFDSSFNDLRRIRWYDSASKTYFEGNIAAQWTWLLGEVNLYPNGRYKCDFGCCMPEMKREGTASKISGPLQ